MTGPTADVPMTVTFPRRQARGWMLGYSGQRCLAILAAVCVLAVSMFAGGGEAGAFSLIVAIPLAGTAFLHWQGRAYAEWAPIATHWLLRRGLSQTQYRAKTFDKRPAGTMGLPGDAASLRFFTEPTGGGAMVHDPHRRTMTAIVQVTYPAYVLQDTAMQDRRVVSWSRVLASLSATDTISAIQVLEEVIPDPGRGVRGWWREHGVHDGSWVAREYDVLMSEAAPASSAHRTLISLALDTRRAAKAIKHAGGGVRGATAVLAGDMHNLVRSLQSAHLTVERWLGPDDLAVVVRQAYDPDFEEHGGGAIASLDTGPAAIEEHWDHLRHDSGYSTVLWVSQWPTSEQLPGFLHALLFTLGVRRKLAIIARPLNAAQAMAEVQREKASYAADRRQKRDAGQLDSAFDAQEERDVKAREAALVAGHSDMRFTGFVTVTSHSLDQLHADVSLVRRAASQCMVETRVLYGQQAQGFVVAALPLARAVA